MSRFASVMLLAWGVLGATPLAAQQTVSSISQYGITWTFAQPVQAGRFVNGDWWVVAPARVASVSPGHSSGHNGSMLNPPAGYALRNSGQGYDSRIGSYQASAAASFPLTMQAGDSLVSTISYTGSSQPQGIYGGVSSFSLLKTAAVLTAVDPSRLPASDEFRPAYCGPRNGKRFRAGQIQWSRLPKLRLVASAPDPATYARYFQRPWLDHLLGYESRMLHPNDNMPDYGREIAMVVGEAGLLLLGDKPQAAVDDLMVNYLQVGLDLYGALQGGQIWWGDGGHMNGRKWPIMFAGLMLGDNGMQSPGNKFSEDDQTYFSPAGNGWTGARALFRMRSTDDHEERPPSTWDANDIKYEKYRRCCTSFAYVGSALCALAMRVSDKWGHQAFFEYTERWMTPMHPSDKAATLARVGSTVTTFPHEYVNPSFVRDMWWAFRNQLMPSGVRRVGQSSLYEIRLAMFDTPRAGQPLEILVSNAPRRSGSCMAALAVGPPQPFLNATFMLAGGPPPVSLPFTADSHGKARVILKMPPTPGLRFAVQLGWIDSSVPMAESTPALELTLAK